jgi:CRP/FNR family transcriptional regulator
LEKQGKEPLVEVLQLPLRVSIFQHKLFQGVEQSVAVSMVNRCQHIHFRPREQVLEPGEKPSFILLILQGWISVYRLTENGHEATVRLYGPADVAFGDMLCDQSAPQNIGATSKVLTQAFGIPMHVMRHALSLSPKLGANLLEIVAQDMHNMSYLIEQITAYPAAERVERLLLQIMLLTHHQPVSAFTLPVKKNELADVLGITRETFSRNLHELEPDIATMPNGQIRLSDPSNLCHVCDLYTAKLCRRFNDPAICRYAPNCKWAKSG